MTISYPTGGFIQLSVNQFPDPNGGYIGTPGQPGSQLTWFATSNNIDRGQTPLDDINDIDEDGELDARVDTWFNGSFTFTGYTITASNGQTYGIFSNQADPSIGTGDYYVVTDTAGNDLIPTSGTSSLYTAETNGVYLCFAESSQIATPEGERRVETLAIGDLVLTADGLAVAVNWVGRQTLHKLFSGPHMQPVRIRAGALGGGLPYSDLTVTADHGMVLDGLVINASALVNGDSIDRVPMDELPDRVTYYHVETENHDVILANGAPAETFVDILGRMAFDNYQEYLDLYGAERMLPEMDRPRISAQRLVPDAIKARLGIVDEVIDFDIPLSA